MCKNNSSPDTNKNDDGAGSSSRSMVPETAVNDDDKPSTLQAPWPEELPNQSFISKCWTRWTYSFMNPLLTKGSRQTLDNGTHLSQKDLFRVPHSLRSAFLEQKFETLFAEDLLHHPPKEGKRHNGRLTRTLFRMAYPAFAPAGGYELITVLCQVSIPLLVREILNLLEEYPAQSIFDKAWPFVVGMFVLLVLNAVANHRHRYLATQSGIVLRSTIVNVIYNRVLRLSPKGRQGLPPGEVTNMVAIDTQKLFEVTQEAHLLWAMPLSIVLVTVCLVIVLGPATLIGVVVLLLMVPVIERVASNMLAIRQKRIKLTDKRVEISTAMIQGIKVTKLNNYEENYKQRVEEARHLEVAEVIKELFFWALSLVVTVVSPSLAAGATFIVYVLVDESNILTAADTFTVLLLFGALRFPINYFGRLLGRLAQALASLERIIEFLEREVRVCDESDAINGCRKTTSGGPLVEVHNATFRIGAIKLDEESLDTASLASERTSNSRRGEGGFAVSGIDVTLFRGEILGLVGAVGAGKSTIINGIIGELPMDEGGSISLNGKRLALVSQSAFVLNRSLRDNVLFGLPFEQDRYEDVLEACCLWPDIELLGEAGDLTDIGERGVTLSGGQQQRVSIARAAYSRPDIVLLDDPLSALDAGTSKVIFDNLRKLLANSAIVLVTHAAHFLSQVDRIVLVSEGSVKFTGSWTELNAFEPDDEKTRDALDHIRSSIQEDVQQSSSYEECGDSAEPRSIATERKSGRASTLLSSKKIMTTEEREHGLSSISTWLLWFKHAGGIPFILAHIFFMTLDRLIYVAVEYWLARWSDGAHESITVFGIEFAPQTDGIEAQSKYVIVYAVLIVGSVIATVMRSEWVVTGGARAARRVFKSMLGRVLFAPMSYFETTPMGRVLNRFTYDIEVVDMTLTQAMSVLMIALGWGVTSLIVMITILPWMACAIVPVIAVYWLLLLHYRKSGADLQRLDAVARSPIQAMLTEALEGHSTIRVFQQEQNFIGNYFSITDESGSALLNYVSAQRWLGVRIEILGSIIVVVATLLVITLNDVVALDPGIVALLIIWSSNFTITLGFLVDSFSEAEAAITAIERVDAMSRLPQERAMKTDEEKRPDSTWPDKGCIEFKDVCMRYRPDLPLSLKGLSFTVPAGKRCGIVGRTGAGKSSLTTALFRLCEIESGQVILDGVDLASLGLSDVRGRPGGMTIIPQNPFLAGATIREFLDPFNTCDDRTIVEALYDVRMATSTDDLAVLDSNLEEGGSNYSVGERQLLNLARARLSGCRVLVLDEATASIDGETDAFVQRMLRTKFADTTLLTVAHRLNTIMDYDLVLCMDAGRTAEIGSPSELLLQENSLFAKLVDATGSDSARALREIAINLKI